MAKKSALGKVTDLKKKVSAIRERWSERFARNSRFFLIGVIIACTIEVVADWNSMLLDINTLRGELRARAQNYASIVSKASLEPVLAYDADGLDALTYGLFDDEEVAFVRFADHQGTTLYDRLRPGHDEKFAQTHSASFRDHYAHAMTRDVNGILQDPDLLATRMAQSRHKDFVQRWTDFIDSAKSLFRTPPPIHVSNPRGIVLYQERLKATDGGHDGTHTYVLSTVVDERGEAWGVVLVAFDLEKQNGVIRGKLLKGTGMLLFLVGLLLVQNVNGRRDKIRQLDAKKRVSEAKSAIVDASPTAPVVAGSLTVYGAMDQAEEVVDGLVWDAREAGAILELVVIDPAGEGHAVASTALHVLRAYRARDLSGSLAEAIAALGHAASMIPLGRPIAPLIARIDATTGAFEAIEGTLGALRIVAADGKVSTPTRTPLDDVPAHVVGPLTRVTGELPPGARLVCVASGIADDGTTVEVARVTELVGRLHGAADETARDVAADAVAWARGKSPRLVDCDLLVAIVERRATSPA